MDDGSVDSGLSLYAAEERRSVAALERATKEMSDVASQASSVEEVTKERWMAYWSEEHQREYYYEVNTRRVLWDKPEGRNLEQLFLLWMINGVVALLLLVLLYTTCSILPIVASNRVSKYFLFDCCDII